MGRQTRSYAPREVCSLRVVKGANHLRHVRELGIFGDGLRSALERASGMNGFSERCWEVPRDGHSVRQKILETNWFVRDR